MFAGSQIARNAAENNELMDRWGLQDAAAKDDSEKFAESEAKLDEFNDNIKSDLEAKDRMSQNILDSKIELKNDLLNTAANSDNALVRFGANASAKIVGFFYPESVEGAAFNIVGGAWGVAESKILGRGIGIVNPLEGTIYTPKVQKQMTSGEYHSFPNIVDNYAGTGTKTRIVGGDGISRIKIDLNGSYGNKPGRFEWIIEPNNTVNHRFFIPNK